MTSTNALPEFIIEHDIPVPPRANLARRGVRPATPDGSHYQYPLYALRQNQSFFVPLAGTRFTAASGKNGSLQQHIGSVINQYRKLTNNHREFVTRTVYSPETSTPVGVRVWRVK